MIFIVFLTQIKLDRSSFEDPFGLARSFVDDGWDTAIGVDFEKPRLLLRVLRNIDLMSIIFDPEFFEGDADFVAVGCAARVSRCIVTTPCLSAPIGIRETYKSISVFAIFVI